MNRIGLGALMFALFMQAAGAAGTSLYQELGERAGIERAVDAIIVEVKTDKRIKDLFAETDFPYLRERLVEQICNLADGPCEYTGLSMEDAHSGMAITTREFNWFVEDVEIGLEKADIALQAQNALLARFAKLRGDVIGK
jgi:hemoglobin